jgi:hypothetical protein
MSGQADCTSAHTFGPHERARLARILSMLSSPYENERAAAGLLASVFLTKRGLAWADILGSCPSADAEIDAEKPKYERRRNRRMSSRSWRGYCRRRHFSVSQNLNLLA